MDFFFSIKHLCRLMSTRWQYFTTKGDIFIHSLAKSLVANYHPRSIMYCISLNISPAPLRAVLLNECQSGTKYSVTQNKLCGVEE